MKERRYAVILHADPEEGGFTVTVPALPGCVTQGETVEEAVTIAKDAIELYVDSLIADGGNVPEEESASPPIVTLNLEWDVR